MTKHNMRVCFFVVYLVIAGCATEAQMSGLPIWDFQTEHHQLHEGLWQFNHHSKPSSGNYILDFSASELVATLSQALDKTQGKALVPEALHNLIYPTYDFPSELKANSQNKWSIAVRNENLIVTDWKFIPGRKVGFLWWAEEYETQVRHRIIVNTPNKPEVNSNFLIATEVRERPNKKLPWQEGLVEYGRESFEELKKMVIGAITSESKTLSDVDVE